MFFVLNREGGSRTLEVFPSAAGQLSSNDGIVQLMFSPDNANS